jgi:hypothetical protein
LLPHWIPIKTTTKKEGWKEGRKEGERKESGLVEF